MLHKKYTEMVMEVTKTINRDWSDARGKESANQHENNYAIIDKQSVQYMHSVSGAIDLVIDREHMYMARWLWICFCFTNKS